MTFEEYKILRKRLAKGKKYLHKEYYTAYGGKGRTDPEILRTVDLWMQLSWTIQEYEQENGIYPGGQGWMGLEKYKEIENDKEPNR